MWNPEVESAPYRKLNWSILIDAQSISFMNEINIFGDK